MYVFVLVETKYSSNQLFPSIMWVSQIKHMLAGMEASQPFYLLSHNLPQFLFFELLQTLSQQEMKANNDIPSSVQYTMTNST